MGPQQVSPIVHLRTRNSAVGEMSRSVIRRAAVVKIGEMCVFLHLVLPATQVLKTPCLRFQPKNGSEFSGDNGADSMPLVEVH
jgi:hypothetical protein